MFSRNRKTSRRDAARQSRLPAQREVNREFFSYHANRQDVTSGSSSRERLLSESTNPKKLNLQKVPMIFAILCLVISAFYITTIQSNVVLRTSHKSVLLRNEKEYRKYIKSELDSSLLNKNKVTIDSNKIQQQLTSQFPELSSVEVSIPLIGHRPVIELTAEKPALIISTQKGQFVLNKNGKAIAKVSTEQPLDGITIPTLNDEANIPIELGKGALTSQDVAFITTIVMQFENKKIPIESLTLPPLASELRVKTVNDPYYIKFSLMTNPRIAAGQYFAVRKKLETDGVMPKEYIDARVEEKVFIK